MGQTEWSTLVESICAERGLSVVLSWDMPQGYETANGTFDPVAKTLFLNPAVLQSAPEYETMFYLVHELRHAEQYQHPERFDAMIRVSLPYVVLYDGTCFRLRGETWQECRLDGGEERFRDAYLGFPYEVDANEFAAQRVKAFCGDSTAAGLLAAEKDLVERRLPAAFSRDRRENRKQCALSKASAQRRAEDAGGDSNEKFEGTDAQRQPARKRQHRRRTA